MNKYRVILFDLGNVVFEVSFDLVFQFWADASGKAFTEIKSKFQYDETFNEFERAEISPEIFRARVSKQLGISISDEQFDKGWCNLYLDVYNGIDKLLDDLKPNYRIAAFSNTNIIHKIVWEVKYANTLNKFERVFCSHEIKARKPEIDSYQIVLDSLQVKPEETIFLDDNIDNIKGAEKLGITAICVQSTQKMIENLGSKLKT